MRAKHGWRSKYAFGQRIHAGRTCLFSGWAVFLCFALAGGGRQAENRTQRCGLRNEVWFSASTFRTLFLRSGWAQVTEIAEIVAIPSSAVTTSRAELAGISFFFKFDTLRPRAWQQVQPHYEPGLAPGPRSPLDSIGQCYLPVSAPCTSPGY